jgi:hypothetical protein
VENISIARHGDLMICLSFAVVNFDVIIARHGSWLVADVAD